MERLLNPLDLGIDTNDLPVIHFEGKRYRVLERERVIYNNGSCQCFKDCNHCSSQPRKVTILNKWYRNIDFDNSNKCFYSEPYTNDNVYEKKIYTPVLISIKK